MWVSDPDITRGRFPQADARHARLEDACAQVQARTYVVVVTQGAYDEAALQAALDTEAGYMGWLPVRNVPPRSFRSCATRASCQSVYSASPALRACSSGPSRLPRSPSALWQRSSSAGVGRKAQPSQVYRPGLSQPPS